VNLSQKRIREYEKEGFIKPLREKNTNNRLYSTFDVSQINQINRLIHERGFTLACLRNLMVLAPCWNIFDCPLGRNARHTRFPGGRAMMCGNTGHSVQWPLRALHHLPESGRQKQKFWSSTPTRLTARSPFIR
jgi:hypothetical protein